MTGLWGLYLGINVLLIFSYTLLRLGDRSGDQPRWILRCSQITLFLALLAPALVRLLPSAPASKIPQTIRTPLAEAGEFLNSATKPHLHKPGESAEISTPSISPKADFARLGAGLLAISILGFFLRMLWNGRKLLSVLREAPVLKSIGRVRVVTSDAIAVPLSTVVGGKAWVVIPENLLGHWSDFKIAVAHEIQHHRQRDTFWALGFEAIVATFWLNPFIYFWKHRITMLQELSCDEALIGRKVSSHEYSCCLARVAEAALGHRHSWQGATSMASGSFLKRRIEMLSRYSHPRPRVRRPAFFALFTAMTLVTFAWGAQQVLDAKEANAIAPGIATTDPALQKIADSALKHALKKHKASLGFVVVSDVETGRLLAVANQDLSETQAKRTPHWALSLRISPASIIKTFVAATAVEKGKTTYATEHSCEDGEYKSGGRVYKDWKPFSKLSTADTVVFSSNICGIKIGEAAGADVLAQSLTQFGFGPGGTAEGFPESRAGELPDRGRMGPSEYVASIASGYGPIYVSPIELVQAMGAIANGGTLLKPQSSATNSPAQPIRRVLSQETAKQTRQVLADVVTRGTAKSVGNAKYKLAGKTGTGYSRTHNDHDSMGGEANQALFAGFAPAESPKLVILAVIENPTDGKGVHGSAQAAPVFAEVAEKSLQHLQVASH